MTIHATDLAARALFQAPCGAVPPILVQPMTSAGLQVNPGGCSVRRSHAIVRVLPGTGKNQKIQNVRREIWRVVEEFLQWVSARQRRRSVVICQ